MKTGIEKFKNIVDNETCDLLIKYLEDNIDHSFEMQYSENQNVICRQLILQQDTDLDTRVFKIIGKVCQKYAEKYDFFTCFNDTGYQLRKITGETRLHVDGAQLQNDRYNIPDGSLRNISIILGLNSDYEKGEFHFTQQNFSTTLKRGEAIAFPVYFLYPHYVEAPIGSRYTINTWMTTNK